MHTRAIRMIKKYVDHLDVNLNGQVVLTELGSSNYLYLPLIAALAGAQKVYALAKDNRFGKAQDHIKECQLLAEELSLINIEFLDGHLPDKVYQTTTVITNSGNLRPLDAAFLSKFQQDIVIPLMFEAWELRSQDIDIDYCRDHQIRVAGTSEHHEKVGVFAYCGLLATKMAFNAGYEIAGNKIIVFSADDFGKTITTQFKQLGAEVIMTTDVEECYPLFPEIDFVFIAKYDEVKPYFSDKDGIFDTHKIKSLNPALSFIHLYGHVDIDYCTLNRISVHPIMQGKPQVMTRTLGYLGLEPILRLQVASFKVAQEMCLNQLSSISQPMSGFKLINNQV